MAKVSYRYEIGDNHAVKIWKSDIEEAPVVLQLSWPDTTPWASKKEAEDWAALFVESIENPQSEFVPGDSPTEPRRPRVSPESGTSEITAETAE